jgi:hypothetical protein
VGREGERERGGLAIISKGEEGVFELMLDGAAAAAVAVQYRRS